MIVFLVPGFDGVSGGVLAILNHAVETRRCKAIHNADVCVCTIPGLPDLIRFTQFKNDETLVAFPVLLDELIPTARIHINIPEVHLKEFMIYSVPLLKRYLHLKLSFNVMLQNIDFAPDRKTISDVRSLGNVTVTTAHKAYTGKETAEALGCSIYHWSVAVSPERYMWRPYSEKEDLIVVSPDDHPARERTLEALRQGLPGYQFVIVQGISYEAYKQLIERAKYSITFGEGLDGYFVEPIFSGAIGIAVYNDRFFTPEYRGMPGVYDCWDSLCSELSQLVLMTNEFNFNRIQSLQFSVVAKNYSYDEYRGNLAEYYNRLVQTW
jgi:hypothetical protein